MKKIVSILLATTLALLLFACSQPELAPSDDTTTTTATTITQPEENETQLPGNDGIGGDEGEMPPEFSALGFDPGAIPNIFWDYAREISGVDPNDIPARNALQDQFFDYYDNVRGNRRNPQEHALMVFVQYFDISRESFDRLNARWAEIIIENEWRDTALFNADIIFTFDNELIQNYSRNPEFIAFQRTMHIHNGDVNEFRYLRDIVENPTIIAALEQAQQEQVQLQQQLEQEALRR